MFFMSWKKKEEEKVKIIKLAKKKIKIAIINILKNLMEDI